MKRFCLLVAFAISSAPALAQAPLDRTTTVAAQREAMARLAFMDGAWRGPSWTVTTKGRLDLILTERIGTLLGGTLRVLNGLGYRADGSFGYQALGVIAYDPRTRSYSLTAWSMGSARVFPLEVTEDGFRWETTAADGTSIRYRALIRAGEWHEVGERVSASGAVTRVTEIRMRRIGDSAWPAGSPVPMQ